MWIKTAYYHRLAYAVVCMCSCDCDSLCALNLHWALVFILTSFITDRIDQKAKAIASVCPSVRPFVSTLSFKPTDLWIWNFCVGHNQSSPWIESQDQSSTFSAYGSGNIVKRSVWPRSSSEDRFLVVIPCTVYIVVKISDVATVWQAHVQQHRPGPR